jgi:hypothetical protein
MATAAAPPFAAFAQFALPPSSAPAFDELTEGISFERVGRGRAVAVLFRELGDNCVPIVRTTAKYTYPSRPFTRGIGALADSVSALSGLPLQLNNAMAEIYDRDYRTMGLHSDMALDLDPESHIAIYSAYDSPPPPGAVRDLVIVDKATGAGTTVPLSPGTVIVFSVLDNARFLHKIVLQAPPSPAADAVRWLGVTLRTSRTRAKFGSASGPMLLTETGGPRPLELASQAQARELYALRQEENRAAGSFTYPPGLWHTLSPSDVACPWSDA